MRGFAEGCIVLSILTLLPSIGMAEGVAICRIVAVDETGLVTAEETATGTTFEFKPPREVVHSLIVGTPLEADLDARIVLLGERRIPMRKLRRADKPPTSSEETVSAGNADPHEAEAQPRTVTDQPGARRKLRRPEAPPTSFEETASPHDADALPRTGTDGDQRPKPKTQPPAKRKPDPAKDGTSESGRAGKKLTTTSAPTSQSVKRSDPTRSKRQTRGGSSAPPSQANCHATGCSGQICSDNDVITTCEYRPEYACYKSAQCSRQADGNCGWTWTAELEACLENPPPP